MTAAVVAKLLALIGAVALGALAGRRRWLGTEAARVMGEAALLVFVPALLFRTAARVDLAALPWHTLAAYFVPAVAVLLGCYALARWRSPSAAAAAPTVRALDVSFGNSVQLGIPMAAALFGEVGLALHATLVSVHALILLTVATALAERDLAHAAGVSSLRQRLVTTLRNTVVHPVVLPVLLGLLWNLGGLGLPAPVDELLLLLGSAVVPVCLLLIGLSLAQYGLVQHLGRAGTLAAAKLLLLPAAVLVTAHWGFGLNGVALAVPVMMAALPAGSNTLIFAQRYATLEGEATAVIVLSTLAFMLTAPLWLALLALLARG